MEGEDVEDTRKGSFQTSFEADRVIAMGTCGLSVALFVLGCFF